MDFKKLPFWGQFAVVAVMAIALVAVAWMAYPNFSEMEKHNAASRAELESLLLEIRKGQAIEAKLPEFEKEIENLQLEVRLVGEVLDPLQELAGLGLRRQDRQEVVQLELQVLDLLLELRQLCLDRLSLADLV